MSNQILHRELSIDCSRADSQSRTVNASLSSETPVERYFGIEILSHREDAIDMTRARDGLPLLFGHDTAVIVGRCEDIHLEGTKLRATLRLGRSAKADECWVLITDKILTAISVGYQIRKMELRDDPSDGEDTYIATRWMPLEASLVSIAADASVGVNRALPKLTIKDRNTMEINDSKLSKAERQGSFNERERCRDIAAIIDMYPNNSALRELGRSCLADGTALSDFQARVLPLLGSGAPRIEIDDTPLPILAENIARSRSSSYLGMSQGETQRYSLLRAVSAMLDKDWRRAPFEAECSRELEDRLGRKARGLFLPMDIQKSGLWSQRALPLDSVTNTHLIGVDHLAGSFIEALHEKSTCLAAGAVILTNLVGDVSIPSLTSGATHFWLDEDENVTDSEPGTGSVTLSPRTIGGSVPLSRRLLKQASPSIEMILRNDLLQGCAAALDRAAIQGSGVTAEPLGVVNQIGINTQVIAAPGIPTWAEVVGFESALANDLTLGGSLAYVMNPAVNASCKTTTKDSGSGRFLVEGGMRNDYPVYSTSNAPAAGIVFGDWSSL